MEIRKFKDESLKNYTIVNDWNYNKRGFYHESVLLCGNAEIERSRIQYINRTWECYSFQTSMLSVVSKAMEHWRKFYLNRYKADHEYKKMNIERKNEFEAYFNSIPEVITYNKMISELNLYRTGA